ncbi:oligoribonuclease [Bifidobacterium mongoliense]|uniref:oligoribonuclease n=1 Tax=Bifidobacterium mongoliense TaxID=518643 RepID=UPI002647603C|nr:oligoribonuclease [Bifidobacterium mongoliense]MDN5980153.1 oligoribonuclease [Bifidobacterium mongoliense]
MTNTQQNQRSQDVLVWTDVETTGLDPERDVVLEVGMIATDWELNPIDGVKPLHLVTHLDAVDLESMGGVAFGMHERNGLLDECVASSLRAVDASRRVAAWLEALRAGPVVLAGSSVHFDRGFLRVMAGNFKPDPLGGISHRLMDVSVLDMLAEHLYPDVYAHRPERTTNHRVMACLHDSMALYRYYRERLVCGSVMSGVSDCSDGVSGVQDGPVMGGSGVSASAWDEGYQIGLGDGLHGTRNVNPYRGEES